MGRPITATHELRGTPGGPYAAWQPTLLLREQTRHPADRKRPVLFVHGATFPSSCSLMFKFEGSSWADALNDDGFSAWALDFAGFGGAERYPEMAGMTPTLGEPLGRTREAAQQVERAVHAIMAATGALRVSIIAHSWGTMPTGCFAGAHPNLVERIVFFGPIAQRDMQRVPPPNQASRLVTIAEQHKRFVEDVPPGHPGVLLEAEFPAWAKTYLESDPTSGARTPLSVKIPNGPAADIMAARAGSLTYDPGRITAPLAIVRGAWDSVSNDADAAWLLSALRGSPETTDIVIPEATHLMHLEINRKRLYRATSDFLKRRAS